MVGAYAFHLRGLVPRGGKIGEQEMLNSCRKFV
jgi:hypothetical protein